MAKNLDDKLKIEKAKEVKEVQEVKETEVEESKNLVENRFWIILITIYLVALGIILFWALIAFFPATVNDPAAPALSQVVFIKWTFMVSSEMSLILLVFIAGAMGSLVHGFRSLFWYVGNRAFAKSWILMYFLLPLIGSSLSLIFYFVLRGGLFSPNATVDATSPFGFVGVAGLVGMFSNRAALKLQEVAESFFSTKESTTGKDNVDKESIEEQKKAKEKSG